MRRLTVLVSLIVMLDLAMWAAILPLLPDFADRLSLSKFETGVLLAAFSVSLVALSVPVGHFADRVGPRRFTILGSAVMAVSTALIGLDPGYATLIVIRLCQGFASAIAWTAALAWLSASVPSHVRGRSLAVANASAAGGMILGPVIGGTIAGLFGTGPTFVGCGVVSASLGAWALFERPASLPAEHRESELRRALVVAGREPVILVSLVVVALVATVGGTVQVLLPLRLHDGGIGALMSSWAAGAGLDVHLRTQEAIGWLFSLGAVLGAVAIYLTGRLGDRLGRPPVAFWDCLLLGGAVSLFALSLSTGEAAVLLVLIWPIQSVLYGVGYPLSTDGADRAGVGHGLVLGVVNLVWGTGALVGPVVGGGVAELLGDNAAYLMMSVLALVSAGAVRLAIRAPGRPAEAHAPSSRAAR
jgi:MFS family permease